MSVLQRNALSWILALSFLSPSDCFSPQISKPASVARTTSSTTLASSAQDDADYDENDMVIRSPMRFLGPYPTMPLRFPNLATASQRERNITGISLDWVLDTAANVNTINAQVAQELNLEKVGEAPGGVGSGGKIMGGDTFILGDCELDIGNNDAKPEDSDANDDDDEDDSFTFMKELTASALPVASPAAAGLLGLAFFYCFEGGVEFCWGNSKEGSSNPDGDNQGGNPPPSVTFYGSNKGLDLSGMARVPFESLPVSMLPSVTLCINGKEIPALFDTGSPITVLNARAAEEAGITTTIPLESKEDGGKGGWNPFGAIASNMKAAKEMADAQSRGDVLMIAGTDGKPVNLIKSSNPESVSIRTSTGGQQELSSAQIFVGDIPGLAALGGLGGEAPPCAVLGMDLISCRPRVVFRAQQNEIYL